MSIIEYRGLLLKVSQGIDWPTEGETILSLCKGLIAAGSENTVQNVVSLFAELERENNLGIDHLDLLKAILKEMDKWLLFDKIEKFEEKREAYTNLLEKFIVTLCEFDLQRLIKICFPQRLEGNINDVRTLFQELERQNRLTPDCVGVLKRILKEVRREDLLKDVDDFEKKRKDEENADRQRVETEITRQGESCLSRLRLIFSLLVREIFAKHFSINCLVYMFRSYCSLAFIWSLIEISICKLVPALKMRNVEIYCICNQW